MESQEELPRIRRRPNTPARELGLDLGPLDYTAAAWNVPQDTTSTQDAMDSDEDSLITHDTAYDNVDDTYDNVHDVYDVHEKKDVDYGDSPGATRLSLMG